MRGFSWKRALGISSAKAKIARATGIPTTKSGRDRKWGFWPILARATRGSRSSDDSHGSSGCAGCGCLSVIAIIVIAAIGSPRVPKAPPAPVVPSLPAQPPAPIVLPSKLPEVISEPNPAEVTPQEPQKPQEPARPDEVTESHANGALTLAKQYIKINRPTKAAETLQRLIQDYPGTKAVEEAKTLLQSIEHK